VQLALGLEHDACALPATARLAADAAEGALDEVLRAQLLGSAATPHRFAFTHALVREAVLEECNVLRRARIHRRAAEALTALGEDRHLEEIAMHLFEAASTGDARRAAEMLVRQVTARSPGSCTRTRQRHSSARSKPSRRRARRMSPVMSCSPAVMPCRAPERPTRLAQRSPLRAEWPCGATTRCSQRRHSASPGCASRRHRDFRPTA